MSPTRPPFELRPGDWPQLGRDPAHTGYNPAETQLSPDTVAGLQLAWTGGTGSVIYGSPAVADGVVYVASSAVDPSTLANFGGDGKLYAFAVGCGSGGVACSPLWTATIGGGYPSSPAVAEGVVYVGGGGDTAGSDALYAYAVGCGSGGAACTPLWTGKTGDYGVSSPAVAEGVVYVGSGDGRLYAFAAGCASGGAACSPLWTGTIGGANPSSPAVADGVVYVSSYDSGIGSLHAFAVGCASGGGTCEPLWSATTDRGFSPPVVADGVVYVGAGWPLRPSGIPRSQTPRYGKLYAFAVGCGSGGATCSSLWIGTSPNGTSINDSPAVADGVVYVSSSGNLQAFAVGCGRGGRACAPLWIGATEIDFGISSPAVADGVVYVQSGKLYAFAVGCASGGAACSPLWTATTDGYSLSSPAVADGVVYVTSPDGNLYAFALEP